ncbi:hypothetical protein WDU94_012111 [Cyamophila willieti]
MTGLSGVTRKRKMIKLDIPNQMSGAQYVEYIVKTSALGNVGTRGLKRIVRCDETGNTEETNWNQTGESKNMDEHYAIDIKPILDANIKPILDANGHFLSDSRPELCQSPPQPNGNPAHTVEHPPSPSENSTSVEVCNEKSSSTMKVTNENFTGPLRVSNEIFKYPVKVSDEIFVSSMKVYSQPNPGFTSPVKVSDDSFTSAVKVSSSQPTPELTSPVKVSDENFTSTVKICSQPTPGFTSPVKVSNENFTSNVKVSSQPTPGFTSPVKVSNENFTSNVKVSSQPTLGFTSPVKVSNENFTSTVKVSSQPIPESDGPSSLNWLLNFKVSSLFESVPVSTKQPSQNAAAHTIVPPDNQHTPTEREEKCCPIHHAKPHRKPPFTYTELIEQALKEKRQLTVSGIYQWIS